MSVNIQVDSITIAGTPTNSTDGATKNYVDTAVGGIVVPPNPLIYTQTARATVSANSGGGTGTIIGSGVGSLVIPANTLAVGRTIRIKGITICDTTSSGPNCNIIVKLNSTTFCATGNLAFTAGTACTAINGLFEASIMFSVIGSSGIAEGGGLYIVGQVGQLTTPQVMSLGQSASGINTTVNQTIDIRATWASGTAGNDIAFSHLEIYVE